MRTNRKKTLRKEIGKEIRHIRKHLKMTQVELAKAIGVSQAKLSKVEQGVLDLRASEYKLYEETVFT